MTCKNLTKGNNFFHVILFTDMFNQCFPKSVLNILLVILEHHVILLHGHNQEIFIVVVLGFKPHDCICHSFYQANIICSYSMDPMLCH